ncbi:MAG: hydrogenase expression/formation protein [Methylomonas sp.]
MTSISLPIIGQGSQPAEEDGAELDYLHMPEDMAIYRMPEINFDAKRIDVSAAKAVLMQLERQLLDYPNIAGPIDLLALNLNNRQFIDELLGEGEVSAMYSGTVKLHFQESVLAGVWRSQQLNDQHQVIADRLEVGAIPQQVLQLALEDSASLIDIGWTVLPEGVMNAPPLLAELNAKIAAYRSGQDAHIINLSLLPQTEADLYFLEQRLGQGGLTLLSRGYGNCRINATGTRHVWWVRYFNSQDSLILNTLEVSAIPQVACASPEDIADSYQRLQDIMKVYL